MFTDVLPRAKGFIARRIGGLVHRLGPTACGLCWDRLGFPPRVVAAEFHHAAILKLPILPPVLHDIAGVFVGHQDVLQTDEVTSVLNQLDPLDGGLFVGRLSL